MEQNKKMEYLKSKWSIWFHILDADHNGQISSGDMDISAKKFAEIRNLLGDKGSESEVFDNTKWWNDYIFRKGSGVSMTEDEFVESLAEAYQKDEAVFRRKMEQCFGEIAKFVTDNMDRPITEEEFAFGFNVFVFGQVDVGKIDKAYEQFKDAHGQPTVQLLVDAWVQFAADDDQSKQDIIKKIYEN